MSNFQFNIPWEQNSGCDATNCMIHVSLITIVFPETQFLSESRGMASVRDVITTKWSWNYGVAEPRSEFNQKRIAIITSFHRFTDKLSTEIITRRMVIGRYLFKFKVLEPSGETKLILNWNNFYSIPNHLVLSYNISFIESLNRWDNLFWRGNHHTISRIFILPVEFAATKVEDWPLQQTEDMNLSASSISCRGGKSELLLNLCDKAGMGNALWYMITWTNTRND